VSSVNNMEKMFSNCSSLEELNLNSFKENSATNMNELFLNCESLKICLKCLIHVQN